MAISDKYADLMAAETDEDLYSAIDKMTENQKRISIFSVVRVLKALMTGKTNNLAEDYNLDLSDIR